MAIFVSFVAPDPWLLTFLNYGPLWKPNEIWGSSPPKYEYNTSSGSSRTHWSTLKLAKIQRGRYLFPSLINLAHDWRGWSFFHVCYGCALSFPCQIALTFGPQLKPYSFIRDLTDRCVIDVILMGGLKRFNSVITVGITMLRFPQKAPFSGATDSHLKMEGQKSITEKLQSHRLLYLLFSK